MEFDLLSDINSVKPGEKIYEFNVNDCISDRNICFIPPSCLYKFDHFFRSSFSYQLTMWS